MKVEDDEFDDDFEDIDDFEDYDDFEDFDDEDIDFDNLDIESKEELDIFDEKPFLEADGQIQGICKFRIHNHTKAGEIIIKFYRLYHLTGQEKSHCWSLQ